MVNSSAYSTETGVELADVVRRFGPKYTAQYGHLMMPSQKRALADIAACCTPEMGGSLYQCHDCDQSVLAFPRLSQSGLPRNATENRRKSGSKDARPSCCPATIFTAWRPCPLNSTTPFDEIRSLCTAS